MGNECRKRRDFEQSGKGQVLTGNPKVLTCSVESQLKPVLAFLLTALHIPKKRLGVVLAGVPAVLTQDIEGQLCPHLDLLGTLGLSPLEVGLSVSSHFPSRPATPLVWHASAPDGDCEIAEVIVHVYEWLCAYAQICAGVPLQTRLHVCVRVCVARKKRV